MDIDITVIPAGEGSGTAGPLFSVSPSSSSSKKIKRFETKKWNAVALWAWGPYNHNPNPNFGSLRCFCYWVVIVVWIYADMVVDTCAICRNHIMEHCEWSHLDFVLHDCFVFVNYLSLQFYRPFFSVFFAMFDCDFVLIRHWMPS